jgi:hypothetical protein
MKRGLTKELNQWNECMVLSMSTNCEAEGMQD